MPQFSLPEIPKLTLASAIDIIAVALLIYQLVLMVRGRRALPVLTGVAMLGAAYLIAAWAHLELLRSVLAYLASYGAIALIVIFQSEIRRALARIGRVRWLGLGGQLERREMVDEIILALEYMTENRDGALIVIERESGLRTFVESGVPLDATLSRDLLCAIFQPGGALHDGAVIVQRDRVAAAACFLPLTTNPVMQRRLGTRHRAAIGITEETDALALVISEETGRISMASRGDLESDVSLDRVRDRLIRHAGGRQPKLQPAHERAWKQV